MFLYLWRLAFLSMKPRNLAWFSVFSTAFWIRETTWISHRNHQIPSLEQFSEDSFRIRNHEVTGLLSPRTLKQPCLLNLTLLSINTGNTEIVSSSISILVTLLRIAFAFRRFASCKLALTRRKKNCWSLQACNYALNIFLCFASRYFFALSVLFRTFLLPRKPRLKPHRANRKRECKSAKLSESFRVWSQSISPECVKVSLSLSLSLSKGGFSLLTVYAGYIRVWNSNACRTSVPTTPTATVHLNYRRYLEHLA